MRKRNLEMIISSLSRHPEPDAKWEQYSTPSKMVCDILYHADSILDIKGKKVVELGCGNGPFAIGSWILGADHVTGIDIDERAIIQAKNNLSRLMGQLEPTPNGNVEFIVGDVMAMEGPEKQFDIVFMNPPFGAQKKHADRPFIEKAVSLAPFTYSIHNGNSIPFLKKVTRSMGVELDLLWKDELDIPAMYSFHRKERKAVEVVVVGLYRDQSSILKSS